MKRIALLLALQAVMTLSVMAENEYMYVYGHIGLYSDVITIPVDMIDSICFTAPEPIYDDPVTDACGNTYRVIRLGEQYWMAENMKCDKYDEGSERPGQTIQADLFTVAPYYHDGKNAVSEYSEKLTPELRAKLGYLYNFAAYMGYTEEEAEAQTGDYDETNPRQGICPDGFHIPTMAEWEAAVLYIASMNPGRAGAATHLKAKEGWFIDQSYTDRTGIDTYGFCALPAGMASLDEGGKTIVNPKIGKEGFFGTTDAQNNYGLNRSMEDAYDSMFGGGELKNMAVSVRCVQ
ncbi:MAG: hypothetical protein MJ010_05275 [Paludibacteraceae bacterium]|nr:hypothetical protein [Paludibacteraceae bacterium]